MLSRQNLPMPLLRVVLQFLSLAVSVMDILVMSQDEASARRTKRARAAEPTIGTDSDVRRRTRTSDTNKTNHDMLVARAGVRQRDDSDHCVTPTGAKLACTPALDLLTATELQLDRHPHPTAGSVPVPLHLSGSDAPQRKGTHKIVTLGITPHRASGSGCGSNRDVPACLKHSGASPGKARCSELIAIDAQSTSPHDLPDVLGCAYRPRRCARCSIRGSVRPG